MNKRDKNGKSERFLCISCFFWSITNINWLRLHVTLCQIELLPWSYVSSLSKQSLCFLFVYVFHQLIISVRFAVRLRDSFSPGLKHLVVNTSITNCIYFFMSCQQWKGFVDANQFLQQDKHENLDKGCPVRNSLSRYVMICHDFLNMFLFVIMTKVENLTRLKKSVLYRALIKKKLMQIIKHTHWYSSISSCFGSPGR